MTDHEKLTALWLEAGSPLPVNCKPHSCFPGTRVFFVDGDTAYLGSVKLEHGKMGTYTQHVEDCVPDFSDLETEFAMMCEAERVAGSRLNWEELWSEDGKAFIGWLAEPVGTTVCAPRDVWRRAKVASQCAGAHPTRIECALAVIKACR